MKEQGIILFCKDLKINLEKNTFSGFSGFDKSDLITSLLYWDRAVTLNSDYIYFDYMEDDADAKLLIDEGFFAEEIIVLDRRRISDTSTTVAYFEKVNERVNELITSSDIDWVANRLNNVFIDKNDIYTHSGGEKISLINAIPQPSTNVSLDDVLEFKAKRGDNLKQLWFEINSFEYRILTSENKEMELRKAVNEIDKSCADLIRLYKEKNIEFNLTKVDINFSLTSVMSAIATFYGGVSVHLPHAAAMIASLGAGVLSTLDISGSISFKNIDKTNPFIYSADISKYLI
ncbi:DUF6236 family protein [Serratia fonticola]|uniref:DUF6236 family protein n=1 Tax=Serratia fonticola TaxID=47917 RepID=UPI0034C6642B